MKSLAKDMKVRLQQLGVFRALVSGVASMQMRVCFGKWVEYLEMIKSAKLELYRRRRWQLSCPEAHMKNLAGVADLEPQQMNLFYTGTKAGEKK